jgi:predicted ArsR family transcriptional regulator
MTLPEPGARESATAEQLRALAHPVRIRILRLCLDTELTNQQVAEALELPAATTLRHIRRLVETGFLAATAVRTGRRGALERPYRATGLTCQLNLDDVGQPELSARVHIAVTDAYRGELRAAGPDAVRSQHRDQARLTEESLQELVQRIEMVLNEYGDRDEPGGTVVSYLWSLNVVPTEE